MRKEELELLKKKCFELTHEEQKLRDLYLKGLAEGNIQGPLVGYPSIDKVWLKHYEKELITGNIPEQRVFDFMFSKNLWSLENCALKYFGKKISYGKLFFNIHEVAKSFKMLGINEGDIVTICMPSLPEAIYSFYALNRIGAVANLIDPRYNAEKIKKLVNDTESDILIFVDVVTDKVSEIQNEICASKLISVSPAESLPKLLKFGYHVKELLSNNKNKQYMSWKDFVKVGKDYNQCYDSQYNPDAPVAIVYTGGTTGSPKGAVMTTKGLNAIAYHQRSCMPLVERKSKYLDIMPPFIAFGLTCGMNNPLCEGAELDLIPAFDHHKFDQLIMKHKPNHVIGVPSFWEDLSNSSKACHKDFSYLKSVIAGGDSMKPSSEENLNHFLRDHNCEQRLLKGYGMTEVSSCATFTCTDSSNKIGSVGIPLAKNNVMILDPVTKEELGYNQEGEIYINTDSIMGGYLNLEQETKESIIENPYGEKWVKTFDIGYMDEDGCIFIVDRIKNMIIRQDGFKVFPMTIEQYIMSHPAVENCKVVGVKDPNFVMGMLPKAFIVLKKDRDYNEENIISEINDLCVLHLPEYQIPIDYEIKNELPLTSIGKIDVNKLQVEGISVNNKHSKVYQKK